MNSVVEVENLSVAYQMYARPVDQLKELMFGGVRHETFWALRDVSLRIDEGEKLGIIGPNGAGKSTLLKVIAGTMQATSGRVATNGRISSLLSMVPAWNAEDSGIENIRFNLLLNGVPEKKISAMIEDIADFTELGPFLFHPVRTYSTGMGARLSFGIATATEPDILIIDEVLGTGDGYFAWKAAKRMEEFCAKGRAMILVSHAMASIQSMCDRVIWMQNGAIRQEGSTQDVLAAYELDFRRADDEAMRRSHASRGITDDPSISELTDAGHVRLRIVPKTRAPFYSTHYVSEIELHFEQGERYVASLDLAEADAKTVTLDILNSEWGRLHEKDGRICRTLSRLPGRNIGGQILARLPPGGAADINVDLTLHSGDAREEIHVEMLDMATGQWRALEHVGSDKRNDWRRLEFRGSLVSVDGDVIAAVAERVAESSKADADILSVKVMADGGEVSSVVERQPFQVHVLVRFNRSPALADVGLKLTRMDGTYVFWQSSGQIEAGNIISPTGTKLFRFIFDPNVFGSAEYFINASVTNGWKHPDNYPYSDVFARKVNAASFRIVPELNGVDFGLVNQRVAVAIETVESK